MKKNKKYGSFILRTYINSIFLNSKSQVATSELFLNMLNDFLNKGYHYTQLLDVYNYVNERFKKYHYTCYILFDTDNNCYKLVSFA